MLFSEGALAAATLELSWDLREKLDGQKIKGKTLSPSECKKLRVVS